MTNYFLAKLPSKLIIAPATIQGNTVYLFIYCVYRESKQIYKNLTKQMNPNFTLLNVSYVNLFVVYVDKKKLKKYYKIS